MQVNELRSIVERHSPKYITSSLSMLEYSPSSLKVRGTDLELGLTEASRGKFASFLTIPRTFLPKIVSQELQTDIVNHFLEKSPDTEVLLGYSQGNTLREAYPGSTTIIPDGMIVDAIEKTFEPEAKVASLSLDGGIKASIVTQELNTEPRVNDITNGGLRIDSTIGEAPKISAFMERLVCSNGMVVPVENASLSLRGRTVPEIILEMESMAQYVLGGPSQEALDNWGHLTGVLVSNPAQLIHRFAREYEIGSRMEARLLDQIPNLEGDSYYDVVNLITSMQHEEGVSETMRLHLQTVGGRIVNSGGGHRCTSCQHILDY